MVNPVSSEFAEHELYRRIAELWAVSAGQAGLMVPYPPRPGGRTDLLIRVAVAETLRWTREMLTTKGES